MRIVSCDGVGVGVGLLFLPAGQAGFCWSSTQASIVGYAWVVRHYVAMVYPWGGVTDRLPIRLASREDCPLWCRC